jgi:hypothetical protein
MDARVNLANNIKTYIDPIFANMGYKSPITTKVVDEDGDVYLRIDEGEIDIFIDENDDSVFLSMTLLTYKHHSGSSIDPPSQEEVEHGTFTDYVKLIQAVIDLEVKIRIAYAFEAVDYQLLKAYADETILD